MMGLGKPQLHAKFEVGTTYIALETALAFYSAAVAKIL